MDPAAGLSKLHILVVEDSSADAELMLRSLRAAGMDLEFERVQSADAMRVALQQRLWDVVLSDYYMPGFDALAALAVLQQHGAGIPFIVVSGSVGEDTAVAAMKAGATDYVMKDRLARLAPAIVRAVEESKAQQQRRALERQLQESHRLEAIGRLAGGVAHDFNNVLTAILGSAELLLLDVPPGATAREELDIIRDAATRAQDLIRQLLAFGARQVLQPVVLDVNHLVRNVAKMLRRLIGEHIELVPQFGDVGPVRADPGQVEQVLVNLAVNARDAMPDGGRLTIGTSQVDVKDGRKTPGDGIPPGRYVVLEVADTGTGMDAETQARIFEPFFTTKERGKGTGLGLATVYGIVRQSDGHVTVASAPGDGTRFRIYLPHVDEPVVDPSAPAPVLRPTQGKETVLVVEDEPLVRLLAKKILEQAGYRVLVAAGGAEAMEMAARLDTPIDALVSDVVMPHMNGRELARRIGELRPGIPVLYMSGYSDEAVSRHGVLDPGTALIQKPFTPAAFAAKVREILGPRPR